MTPFALATLFPSVDHNEVGVGFYGFEQAQAPSLSEVPGALSGALTGPQGLDLLVRRTFDTEDVRLGEAETATGENFRLSLYRDAAGQLVLDELSAELLLLSFHRRMTLGDEFDLGLLFGHWDEVWRFGDTGRMQWRFYSPLKVTALGFARNDMDDDDRVKVYVGAGAGLGGEALLRVVGPVGLQVRGDAFLSTKNRYRRGDRNTTRHELELSAELGLSGLLAEQAWVLGVWGSAVTQWDPRDAEGRDGVDRQLLSAGLRLHGRFYKPRKEPVMEPDIEAMLNALREAELEAGPGRILDRGGAAEPEPPEDQEPPPADPTPQRPAYEPLELHWSEVTPLAEPAPTWPEGQDPAAVCEVRFFIDPTGVPYDIRPEGCPSELRAPVMEAAWGWRFEPVTEGGDTVSAQFVYPFSAGWAGESP